MLKQPDTPISFSVRFLAEVEEVARRLDTATIERMASLLAGVRERSGRLFILGVGGSAGNASHAVNDSRKIDGQRFRVDVAYQRRLANRVGALATGESTAIAGLDSGVLSRRR